MRDRVAGMKGTDLMAWLVDRDGAPVVRDSAGSPIADCEAHEAVVESDGRRLSFRPGGRARDRRGAGWHLAGDIEVLELSGTRTPIDSAAYPDALGRLWAALTAPHAGDLLVSLREGWECVDWGGTSHAGGGSHGSLAAGDSLCPLVLVGLDPGTVPDRAQWRLTDVAGMVRAHFGVDEAPRAGAEQAQARA